MNGQDKEMELTVRVDGVVRCLVRECRVGEERQMVGSRGGGGGGGGEEENYLCR